MGLLDEAKTEVAPAAEAPAAAKKHNNSEYQKKQRELLKQRAGIIAKYIDSLKNVPEDVKDAVDGIARRGKYESKAGAGGGNFGPSVFNQLFGDSPKAGQTISALDMFNKVHKGFADMRKLMKRWEEKGIATVTFDEAKSEYKLVKLGA